jgi:hypothetical protein
MFLSSLNLCNTSSFLTWSVQLIFSILLQHHISKLFQVLSEVYKFQHHTQLYSKCSTLLVSSLNLSSTCWWKESSSCWKLLSYYISFLVKRVTCFEHYRRFD